MGSRVSSRRVSWVQSSDCMGRRRVELRIVKPYASTDDESHCDPPGCDPRQTRSLRCGVAVRPKRNRVNKPVTAPHVSDAVGQLSVSTRRSVEPRPDYSVIRDEWTSMNRTSLNRVIEYHIVRCVSSVGKSPVKPLRLSEFTPRRVPYTRRRLRQRASRHLSSPSQSRRTIFASPSCPRRRTRCRSR